MSNILISCAGFLSNVSTLKDTQAHASMLPNNLREFLPAVAQNRNNTIEQMARHIGKCMHMLPDSEKSAIEFDGSTRGLGLEFIAEKCVDPLKSILSLHIKAKVSKDDDASSEVNRSKFVRVVEISFNDKGEYMSCNSLHHDWQAVFNDCLLRSSQTLNSKEWNSAYNRLLASVRAKSAGNGHVILDKEDNIEKVKTWLDFAQTCNQVDACYIEASTLSTPMANSLLSGIGTSLDFIIDEAEKRLSGATTLRVDAISNNLQELSSFGDYLNDCEQMLANASTAIKEKFASLGVLRQQALDKWQDLQARADGKPVRSTPTAKKFVSADEATAMSLTKKGKAFVDGVLSSMDNEGIVFMCNSTPVLKLLFAMYTNGTSFPFSKEMLEIRGLASHIEKGVVELSK